MNANFEVNSVKENVAFWDIKAQVVPHGKHITSPLQSTDGQYYVRLEVFTAVTMKNVVFWDIKNEVRTSQEAHYVSTTESSQLMLCKICGFHGSDYEECRLLGYKKRSPYFTGGILRLHYRVQPVNVM
jgi:hypothetical protein